MSTYVTKLSILVTNMILLEACTYLKIHIKIIRQNNRWLQTKETKLIPKYGMEWYNLWLN